MGRHQHLNMRNPSNARDVLQQFVNDAIQDQFQVTRLDTQELNSKLNWVLGLLALTVTLLISTYGAMTFFMWRLVSLLIGK